MNRRNFFSKVCTTAVCSCGFFGLISAGSQEVNDQNPENIPLSGRWIRTLLEGVDKNSADTFVKEMIKKASVAHFTELNMEELLKPYIGKPLDFIAFLEKEWGWKVDIQDNTIIADEKKNYCVCPIVRNNVDFPSLMCYCSEGFAEKMFTIVTGKKTKAEVINSILKGDESCKYKINLM